MRKLIVEGGRPLSGSVTISGAKNAVLPLIAATILADGTSVIHDVPHLSDVGTMNELMKFLGAHCSFEGSSLHIDTTGLRGDKEAPGELVRKMRASFLVMGPLLARRGYVRMSLPGGCAIGARPIDLHLKGFEAMGAEINMGRGYVEAKVRRALKGNRIYLDFPSVGATENLMMAASLAEGTTLIGNAAQEPEIIDLANLLSVMGAKIKGAGTSIIRIEGVKQLKAAQHTVIPDRIEAGSYMIFAAAAGGTVRLNNVIPEHMQPLIAKLREAGVKVACGDDCAIVESDGMLEPVAVKTLPYPGFPTEMQAQMMALLTRARGTSLVTETVFENRFMHAEELRKMGADITVDGHTATVNGVSRLHGAAVSATDLRAGAALITAALMAEGRSEIGELQHIERGYERIVEKLQGIGADVYIHED